MKASEAIARALAAEGDAPVFSLMGDGTMNLIVQIAALGSPIVTVRHEAAAVAMADGWARSTGRVGVAAVTCGPGLTQTGTSLVAASRNRTPLVLLTGGMHSRPSPRGQELDQRPFAQACECLFQAVQRLESLDADVRDAFYTARTARRPVLLEVPMDLQERELDYPWAYRPSTDFVPRPQRQVPDQEAIEAAAAMIQAAERPLIIAGRGARLSDARTEVILLADAIGALLGTTLLTKGWFDGHAWDVGVVGAFCSAAAEAVIADADLVIGVGAELGQYTTEGGLLFPEAQAIRIDVETADLVGPLGEFQLRGDAREVLRALQKAIAVGAPRTGFRTAAVRQRLEQQPEPHAEVPPGAGVDPRQLMAELGSLLPRDALLFCGIGHFWSFLVQYMPLRADVELNFVHQFGSIGQALPTAIGAAVASPTRPLVILDGDGSLMMHIQELDTAARYGLDITVIVANDGGFGAEAHKLRASDRDEHLASYPSPDFAAVASGFGGSGHRIDDLGQFRHAMRSLAGQRRPTVLDVRVSPQVVSDPYRRLHFGLDNRAPRLSAAATRP
jgi:thiamine pyrophosphate-dependent acetolactate synthase large subunit-like protein